MADDIIMRARQRRERLLAEVARIDDFLAMAAELEREDNQPKTSASKPRQSARRGVGIETVEAAAEILRDRGPLSTRDLVPMIEARGIEIGGKSNIATLSARLSGGKGVIELIAGKWRLVENGEMSGEGTDPEQDESADDTVRGRSADSLFNQTKEDR